MVSHVSPQHAAAFLFIATVTMVSHVSPQHTEAFLFIATVTVVSHVSPQHAAAFFFIATLTCNIAHIGPVGKSFPLYRHSNVQYRTYRPAMQKLSQVWMFSSFMKQKLDRFNLIPERVT